MKYEYRLKESIGGWQVVEIDSSTVIYRCSTSLPVSRQDIPSMYADIKRVTGVDHTEIEDGYLGQSI